MPPVAAPAGDPLDAYPHLKFPAARATVTPREIAEKLSVSTAHVYDLIDEGQLGFIDLTGAGNNSDRKAIRVPIVEYYAFLRKRLSQGWLSASADQLKFDF